LKAQKTANSQGNTEQKKPLRVITIPDFKLYYRAIIKTAWKWDKNRKPVEQRRPDMIPHSYAQMIFDKVPKTYKGEKTVSSTNVAGKIGYFQAEN
jgi:hypothetical protein